jgi:hypothetical protein
MFVKTAEQYWSLYKKGYVPCTRSSVYVESVQPGNSPPLSQVKGREIVWLFTKVTNQILENAPELLHYAYIFLFVISMTHSINNSNTLR